MDSAIQTIDHDDSIFPDGKLVSPLPTFVLTTVVDLDEKTGQLSRDGDIKLWKGHVPSVYFETLPFNITTLDLINKHTALDRFFEIKDEGTRRPTPSSPNLTPSTKPDTNAERDAYYDGLVIVATKIVKSHPNLVNIKVERDSRATGHARSDTTRRNSARDILHGVTSALSPFHPILKTEDTSGKYRNLESELEEYMLSGGY